MDFDATKVPERLYNKIVAMESVPELTEMRNRYRGKKNADIRTAIDGRIQNLKYHQGNADID